MSDKHSLIQASIDRIRRLFLTAEEFECSASRELMSAFIDSMTTVEETQELQEHLSGCPSCQRQLQLLISVKNLLSRVEYPAPPDDLSLISRIRLSHERVSNRLERLETRLANFLKPIAVPAVLGVSFTALFFGVLLMALSSSATVMANDQDFNITVYAPIRDVPVYALKPVRTTDNTKLRLAASVGVGGWDEPLTVETIVSDDGRAIDYRILAGPDSPEVHRWLREMLYFSEFNPATAFGKPVGSRMILTFMGVRS